MFLILQIFLTYYEKTWPGVSKSKFAITDCTANGFLEFLQNFLQSWRLYLRWSISVQKIPPVSSFFSQPLPQPFRQKCFANSFTSFELIHCHILKQIILQKSLSQTNIELMVMRWAVSLISPLEDIVPFYFTFCQYFTLHLLVQSQQEKH